MTKQRDHQHIANHLEQLLEEVRCLAHEGTHIKIGTKPVEDRTLFVCTVLQNLLFGLKDARTCSSSMARQIHAFIISRLHQGPTLKDLSLFLGYSEKYCSQLFHTILGQSFRSYLKTLRVELAKLLLQEGHASLIEIAAALGFSDQFAFSHFFKNAEGCSPTYFRTLSQEIPKIPPAQKLNVRASSSIQKT